MARVDARYMRAVGGHAENGRRAPGDQTGNASVFMGNYLIAYREIAGGVEIVRVLHGARRWQGLL